ncbi:MAG: Malonyl CoA-acyl carrier protein transacylase [Parachlamydiales bacterium]|nr:Malonyl CoA-acyl carrier protein transacylase [Parachlamydiales bacterium]
MKNIAFLFPGQGAQYPGMGKDFFDAFEIARHTFEEADDLLSFHLSQVIFEGPAALLTETRYSQAAIFVNSMAMMRTLQELLPELIPAVCSGLSLGEYTALCASGRLSFAETLRLIQLRGEYLNDACVRTKGSMSAVLGLEAQDVEEAIRSIPQVWIANFNCPGQTVISGTHDGIRAAGEVLKQKGAKRLIPLQVQGAFHSRLMQSAQDRLKFRIAEANIVDSATGFVMNVTGSYVDGIDPVKDNLTRQVTHSVRWEQGVRAMMEKGVSLYLEIGCGKTLTGMNKKMGMTQPFFSIEKVCDLDGVARQIEGVVGI